MNIFEKVMNKLKGFYTIQPEKLEKVVEKKKSKYGNKQKKK